MQTVPFERSRLLSYSIFAQQSKPQNKFLPKVRSLTMKLAFVFVIVVAFFFASPCQAEIDEDRLEELQAIIKDLTLAEQPGGAKKIAAAIREVRGADGCDPNICFAIDGSKALGKADFELQLQFIAIVTAIVGADERAHFSGVQYGLRNRIIRNIRGNADDFLLDIEDTKWLKAKKSFIGGGVSWCVQQLQNRRGEPSKMVIFGDGRSSYGGLGGALGPAALAADFRSRSPANAVCAVAVGSSRTDLFNEITQDKSLVLTVKDWSKVLDVLRALVRNICEVEPEFRRR